MVEAHMDEVKMDLMMANIAFLSVALGGAVHTAMDLFMWRHAISNGDDDLYAFENEVTFADD